MNENEKHYLTVEDLIDRLKNVGERVGMQTPVLLSRDPEGNGFHAVHWAEEQLMGTEEEAVWGRYIEGVYSVNEDPDELPDEVREVVVLWP